MRTRRAWPMGTGTTGHDAGGARLPAPLGALAVARALAALLLPVAVAVLLALLALAPRVAFGQEGGAPPPPPAPTPPPPEANPWEQFITWLGGGGNDAVLRLFLWLFDALVLRFGGWLAGVVGGATGADLGPGQSITVQLPRALTVDAPWVRTSFGVFQRVINAGLYGVFLLALVASAVGGLLGFTTEEARSVTGLTVLVWYANRRALELVGYLLDLANTAAAQFADVGQMLPGFQDLNGLQQGSANGANAILLGLFGVCMAFVRWMTLFGVNALIVTLPLAVLLAVCWPTRWLFTVWWRALAGLVLSQVGIALLLGQAQAFTARWGAGGGALFLVGTCACLWLAARVPRMLGGLAALPAQAAGGATATARQYALMAAASATGNAVAGRAVLTQVGPAVGGGSGAWSAPPGAPQPGPTWRTQPLIPAPLAGLPAPRRYGPDVVDVRPLSVE